MKSGDHQYFFAKDRQWSETPDGMRYAKFTTVAGDPTRPLNVITEYPPNHRVEPHTHDCHYTEVILEGELTVGKIHLVKGDVRVMQAGVGYGPLLSGACGCRVLTIFDRADGSQTRSVGAPQ
jgi:hypothetical protein